MNPKRVTWPQAAIVVAVIAGVVVLSILGRDLTSVIALGIAIFGAVGLGAGQMQGIKDQVNGNLTRLLDMMEKHVQMLAAAHVPPSALPPATPDQPAAPAGPAG